MPCTLPSLFDLEDYDCSTFRVLEERIYELNLFVPMIKGCDSIVERERKKRNVHKRKVPLTLILDLYCRTRSHPWREAREDNDGRSVHTTVPFMKEEFQFSTSIPCCAHTA